jgi:P27 family predicted phage terminase small subunit
MRGRKPKPTHLKLVDGNPGRRPVVSDEFRPEAEVPECPEHLSGEGRREWERVTQILFRHGMVSCADRGALAMLCTLWDRYVTAELMIERAKESAPASAGLFVKSPNNFPIQSPWLAVSNRAIEQYRTLCAEFGLTPASRVRVSPTTAQMDLFGDAAKAGGTGRFFS